MRKFIKIPITILLLLAVVSCGKKDFRRDYFTVSKIISGNKIKLINGYNVTLIGIENNKKTKNFLKEKVKNNRVRFVFDSRCPLKRPTSGTKDKSFYAYIILERNDCVNSRLLKENLCRIAFPQPYLNDSLRAYQKYSSFSPFVDTSNFIINRKKKSPTYKGKSDITNELERLIQACDYNNSITRDYAVSIASKSSGKFNIGQICEIYDAIRPPKWKYVNDPRGEEFFSKASHTIQNTHLSGDCDDFAILMYSLITAIGGKARIVFAYNDHFGHAFAELNITSANLNELKGKIQSRFHDYVINDIFYRTDSKGNKWLNLDWWASYPGGKYMNFNKSQIFYPYEKTYE